MVTPSIIIITLLAGLITNFADLPVVKSAFAGIRVCVCVLILNSVLKLWKSAVKDRLTLAIFVAVLACSVLFDWSPVVFVLAAGLLGVGLVLVSARKEGKQ